MYMGTAHRASIPDGRGRMHGHVSTQPGKMPTRTSRLERKNIAQRNDRSSTVGQPGHGIKASQKGAMAESPTPLASDIGGPHRIDHEGREEHSFLHGTNGEEVQYADGRGPEHPRKIRKTELDRMKSGVATK